MGIQEIPAAYPSSYKIDLSGFNKSTTTIKVVEGDSVKVSVDGTVEPAYIPLSKAKAFGYVYGLDNVFYDIEKNLTDLNMQE